MIEAKIIADSISEEGIRLTTFQVRLHRFILPELNTHRAFSRNYSSSRAIPVKTILDQVRRNPAMPVHFGKNQPGMQAREELSGAELDDVIQKWNLAANLAADMSEAMMSAGVHKQIANRITEPFQWTTGIITATDYENFFRLRDHKDAQPEIRALAIKMKEAYVASTPKVLKLAEWHLPYVAEHELQDMSLEEAKRCSAARCARVSYNKHDGTKPSMAEDFELFGQLVVRPFEDKRGNVLTDDDPIHASPCEHQATPDRYLLNEDEWTRSPLWGNFYGWVQYRKILELNGVNNGE